MATAFTHPVIALGLFPWFKSIRNSYSILLTGMVLTALPDLDVIGYRYGIPYDHLLGHRGLTHSIFFAAVFSALPTLYFSLRHKISFFPIWIFLFLSMASHGFIDAMTNGGLGIAFLSPFSNERYFLPFQPIEVSTLSIKRFFQGQGIAVMKSELLYIWPPAILLMLLGILARLRR